MTTGDAEYLSTTFLEELDRRATWPRQVASTGVGEYDALLDGGYREGLHVLAGLPGAGKTSFALALAARSAQRGIDVAYLTLEQPKRELWLRVFDAFAVSESGDGLSGQADATTFQDSMPSSIVRRSKAWTPVHALSHRLQIIEGGDALTLERVGDEVDRLHRFTQQVCADSGVPPLVIVDYLQLVPAQDTSRTEPRERVGRVVGLLQLRLAREQGATVLALSSINRASYDLTGSDPRATSGGGLASLKEAGEIEYTASTVTLLTTEGSQRAHARAPSSSSPSSQRRQLLVVKNRFGETGRADASWDPHTNTWDSGRSLDAFDRTVEELRR